MNLATLPIDELAEQCAENTQKFLRQAPHDTEHCFELLRRALAETEEEAFTRAYHIYLPQVMGWVYRHPRFSQTHESADHFANLALTKFYFALRGEKFQHFSRLSSILSYLKACVYTAIAQYLRKQGSVVMIPLEEADIGDQQGFDRSLNAASIWNRVCELLPDETDRLLADCVFRQDLKPAEIARVYTQRWGNPRAVSVALQRIRRVLRRDSELQEWLGV